MFLKNIDIRITRYHCECNRRTAVHENGYYECSLQYIPNIIHMVYALVWLGTSRVRMLIGCTVDLFMCTL